jgi:uncharacterized protein
MNICIKTYAKQITPKDLTITLNNRLPSWVQSPCQINCTIKITSCGNFYLLNLTMDAVLHITCQRCLSTVHSPFHHTTELALCFNEEKANDLMTMYDTVVVESDELNLDDLLTDELHLFAPEIPHEIEVCHIESI